MSSLNWREWIADRFGLYPIRENTLDRRVVKTPWYHGDGATLFLLLIVLVVTGAFMTLTYSPSPDAAYASVQYISEEQPMGQFIRGLHYWSAGLFVVMTFVHVFRHILLGGYKFPREGTWLIGVAILLATFIMAFVGYLLRWDERAVNAIAVVTHMFSRVPLIGEELVLLVQGGESIGASTLLRLYAVHVIFVPLLLLGFVGYHLYLVILHSVITSTEQEQPVYSAEEQRRVYEEEAESVETGEPFYPYTVAESGLMAMAVFLVAVGLAVFYGPPELFPEANLTEPSRPRAEWWYWWYDALIAVVPHVLAPILVVVFPLLLFAVLVLLPFLDRGPDHGIRQRPLVAVVVGLCVIALVTLSVLRWQAPWEGRPQAGPPPVPAGVELTEQTESGRQLFAQYGCNSCHAVDGVGPKIAPDLAGGDRRLTQDEIRELILDPGDIPMPSYEGRLTEEELEQIVAFVFVLQAAPLDP